MGNTGTKSTNTIEKVNQTSLSVSSKVLQSCTNSATIDQSLSIVSGGDVDISDAKISQKIASVVNFSCVQKSQLNQDISSAVATAIEQQAKAEGYDLTSFLSKTESETIAKIKSEVSLSVENYISQESQNFIDNSQRMKIAANGNVTAVDSKLSQEISVEAVAKGIADAVVGTKIVQDISDKIDQKAEAETKSVGVDLTKNFTDIFTLPVIAGIVLAFVFLVIVVIGIVVAVRSGRSDSESGSGDVSGSWQSKFREVLEL